MTKSALVKIGLPTEQAQSARHIRQLRQILDQRDAAVARLDAAMNDKIRELVNGNTADTDEAPVTEATA